MAGAITRLTQKQVEAEGFVEGEDFYVDRKGVVRALKPNETRKCQKCGQENASFYSALHKTCRTCLRRARDGVVPGSTEAIARDAAKLAEQGVSGAEAKKLAMAAHQKADPKPMKAPASMASVAIRCRGRAALATPAVSISAAISAGL